MEWFYNLFKQVPHEIQFILKLTEIFSNKVHLFANKNPPHL
jgi:hypothetical protein